MTTKRKFTRLKSFSSGQGMVEFALLLPVLIVLTAGIVEFGRLLAIYNGLSNSAREAARLGAAVNISGSTPYYTDCAGMREAARRTSPLLTLADADIVIAYDHGSGSTFANCAQDTEPSPAVTNGDRVKITVTGHYAPIMPLLPMLRPFDMTFVAARSIFPNIVIGTPSGGGGGSNCYTLTVSAGAGGSVSQPASNCGSGQFSGTKVITPTANSNYYFVNWTQVVNGITTTPTNNPLTITPSTNDVVTVTANFASCHLLTITKTLSGASNATLNSASSAVINNTATNCARGDGQGGYTNNTSVSLVAYTVADPYTDGTVAYKVNSWSGVSSSTVTSTGGTASLTMTANTTVTVDYVSTPCYVLSKSVTSGSGSITQTPSTADCKSSTNSFITGGNVTLTGVPAGSTIVNWTGSTTSLTKDLTLTMTSAKTANANFLACMAESSSLPLGPGSLTLTFNFTNPSAQSLNLTSVTMTFGKSGGGPNPNLTKIEMIQATTTTFWSGSQNTGTTTYSTGGSPAATARATGTGAFSLRFTFDRTTAEITNLTSSIFVSPSDATNTCTTS